MKGNALAFPFRFALGAGLLLILGFAAPALVAHPEDELGSVIELQVHIVDNRVEVTVSFPASVYIQEVVNSGTLTEFRDMPESEIATRTIAWFAENNPVLIDGVHVRPLFESADLNIPPEWVELIAQTPTMMGFAQVSVRLRYEAKGQPDQVILRWNRFFDAGAYTLAQAPGIPANDAIVPVNIPVIGVITVGENTWLLSFSAEFPEYRFARTAAAPDWGDAVQVETSRDARYSLPLLSLLLLLLAGYLFFLRSGPFSYRPARLGLVVLAVFTAVLLWPSFRLVLPGITGSTSRLPEGERAVGIFQTLHRNIYRAFDYDTDEAIYDTLEYSIAGPELDRIYRQVFESLVLQEEGGAIARVQDVEYLESRRMMNLPADKPTESAGFTVFSHWRVRGVVRHWGHVHERVNEFKAEYDLAAREGQWKIVESRIREQERLVETP